MWTINAAQSSSNICLVFLPSQMAFSCFCLLRFSTRFFPHSCSGRLTFDSYLPKQTNKHHQNRRFLDPHPPPLCPYVLMPSCDHGGIFHASLWTSCLCVFLYPSALTSSKNSLPLSILWLISISLFTIYWTFLIGIQVCFSPILKKKNRQHPPPHNFPSQLLLT